jgi:hypothetical protein
LGPGAGKPGPVGKDGGRIAGAGAGKAACDGDGPGAGKEGGGADGDGADMRTGGAATGGRVDPGCGAWVGIGGAATCLGGATGGRAGFAEKVICGPEGSGASEGFGRAGGAAGLTTGLSIGSGSGSSTGSGAGAVSSAGGSASVHSGLQASLPAIREPRREKRPTDAAENEAPRDSSENLSPRSAASFPRSGAHAFIPAAVADSRTNQACRAVRPRQARAGGSARVGSSPIAALRPGPTAAPTFGPGSVKS